MSDMRYITIGCSAGSGPLIENIISHLPKTLIHPIIVVRHISQQNENTTLAELLAIKYDRDIREPLDKEYLKKGVIYFAPAGYHLHVEKEGFFSLSLEDKVNYSRPSIDVFFDSIAHAFGSNVVGIILSGANSDGANGISTIKHYGGCTIAQDPEKAEFPTMPLAAINNNVIDHIFDINRICQFINNIKGSNTIESKIN